MGRQGSRDSTSLRVGAQGSRDSTLEESGSVREVETLPWRRVGLSGK